ncbi:MAG: PorT family protein, partial [Chitinophagaceae bacterium]|nr:PorT family protein [Chitinophagaceae bacterium]
MKHFIFFSLFFLFTIAGNSQVLYGVKGGLNLSTFTGNDVESPKFHPSFHIGGFVNFLISGKITLQPEVLFSGKGVRSDAGTYKLGYINVPVLAQYNDPSGFYAEAGPQAGLLLNSKLKSNGESRDIKDWLKSADFAWVFGLGYKMAGGFG